MRRAPGADHARRTAAALGLAAFLLYALTGGGRIVGSDEVTMLELSRAMLQGRIDVPEGATLRGPDGRYYTKNSAGQALAALPLVAVAEGAANAAGLPPARRELAVRFLASFFDAVVAALLLATFTLAARRLGIAPRPALVAGAMLGLTTPLWVYAKSFMGEPLQALGLLLALTGAARARAGEPRAERLAGAGAALAVAVKLSMLPLALGCLLPLARVPAAERRRWAWPAGAVALALLFHLAYDFARFRNPLETGYGAQATPAAYGTPLLVGLYGLLLSSGKGLLWFAPMVWLVPFGLGAGGARGGAAGEPRPAAAAIAARGALVPVALALALYATFEHWAGDGSWGPRYLVPVLPLLALAVARALEGASRARRAAALALGLAGLAVQIAGVAIYFGAEMREVGDYPYTLALGDPRFMSDSHWNPAFSPIRGHWRMLSRNLGEHLRGEAPRLEVGGAADPRLGIDPGDQQRLLHALDFWWAYALYAGVPGGVVAAAALALAVALALAIARLARRVREETRAP
ncbi:MAG TPA: hypothetical protein VGK89_11055 [Candidatus Eisenbacteria bacterium]|jgi:hypothetical protein